MKDTLRPEQMRALESNQMMSLTARQATQFIYRKEGLPGFMRGFVPSLMKNTLVAGTYFSMLYYTETLLKATGLFGDSQVAFLASAFSRTFQTIIANPIIVVKTRLEVVGFQEYGGTTDAFRQICLKEGVGGLFTGLRVSLIRDVPFSGIFYPIYSLFKTYFMMAMNLNNDRYDQPNRTLNLAIVTSAASFSANAVCCVITNPLDLIRTRAYF